jgi:hypothetical protein
MISLGTTAVSKKHLSSLRFGTLGHVAATIVLGFPDSRHTAVLRPLSGSHLLCDPAVAPLSRSHFLLETHNPVTRLVPVPILVSHSGMHHGDRLGPTFPPAPPCPRCLSPRLPCPVAPSRGHLPPRPGAAGWRTQAQRL